MLIEELVKQGLSQKEAEVYIALVRYGGNRAATLCKTVKINRTLVYAILESLVQKGFVEKIIRNSKAYYVANDPQLFVQNATTQLKQSKFLLQSLHNIQLTKSLPVIRTFQGISGIKQMIDLFLDEAKQAGSDLLQMGQEIQFVVQYPEVITAFVEKRVKNKISLKLICNRFPHFEKYISPEINKRVLREVKVVEKGELDVDCTTYIYGDSMVVVSLADEMQGYILKSNNIAGLQRKMFYLLWERL